MSENTDLTIECQYTCNGCGLKNVTFKVKARGEEDVVEWIKEQVNPALVKSHRLHSPHCSSDKYDLKISLPAGCNENSRVGDPSKH